MDILSFRDYCLSLPGVTESFPFGEDTLVFKVGGKIFALAGINLFESFNVKCDPEKAIELRDQYPEVIPGYHMNKRHWNTVSVTGRVPENLLKNWISESYHLVFQSLSKRIREELDKKDTDR